MRCGRGARTWTGSGRAQMRGDEPLGVGEGTSALQDLADLDELESALRQDYPGARLDDIDEEAVRRALGRRRGRRAARAAPAGARAGGPGLPHPPGRPARPHRQGGPPARADRAAPGLGRRCGAAATATHDVHDAGAAGELTGASRPWQFGDEQPLDVVRTLTNAVRRGGRSGERRCAAGGRGLRGRRDRAAHVRGGVPAGGHVLLDGAARHLGPGQGDRARAARAGERAVPAGRPAAGRVLVVRARALRHRAGRPRSRLRAGHQPAARVDARRALPGQAPGRRAGRAGRHRRRADRAPAARRRRRTSRGRRTARRSR